MPKQTHVFGLALALASSMPLATRAQTATSTVLQDNSGTSIPGSLQLRQTIGKSEGLPLTKRWADFSPAEKAAFRENYENMKEGDEPPFPIDGLAPIVRRISEGIQKRGYEGEILIHVTVDAKGEATSVKLVKHPSVEIAKFVAYALVTTKYKPALCAGVPCASEFPFETRLILSR